MHLNSFSRSFARQFSISRVVSISSPKCIGYVMLLNCKWKPLKNLEALLSNVILIFIIVSYFKIWKTVMPRMRWNKISPCKKNRQDVSQRQKKSFEWCNLKGCSFDDSSFLVRKQYSKCNCYINQANFRLITVKLYL